MTISTFFRIQFGLIGVTLAALSTPGAPAADRVMDAIDLARLAYVVDRDTVVMAELGLTPDETKVFLPLYSQYRESVEKLGDGLVKLVLEYGDAYPAVSEKKASQLLNEYLRLETHLVRNRKQFARKFLRVLPASKVARFIQIENRLDIGLRMRLAGAVPLMSTPTPTP